MERIKVKELMLSISEFPCISSKTTFIDAVDALEKADEAFRAGKGSQRILLVYDTTGKIIGKISPMDVVQGLEPNYDKIDGLKGLPRFSDSMLDGMLESMREQLRLWQKPLGELCQKAYQIRIENFIKLPTPDHMVAVDDNMDTAFHLFVVGRHDSLFVKDGTEIVGLIRFSDVYRKIKETIRACPVPA
jgi:hypothetical protein